MFFIFFLVIKPKTPLQQGKPILLYDSSGREGETDIVIHAKYASPQIIRLMRKQAGGLICLAVGEQIAETLNLPHLTDIIEETPLHELSPLKTAYGDKPAFSWPINHKDTYTGITDEDRSLTITRFQQIIEQQQQHEKFVKQFYAPGHVPLLCARNINHRRGHTELSIELAKHAHLTECMVLCEMMADDHKALSHREAEKYAKTNNLLMVDGESI
ncbi:MAG: 3,4-dihydroxy-2-butanone-4-phosphate synthase [Candidatus Altiarchaeales archaeon]|nr:3,4-dihydroxy-2-butanone-4-phosphate synthase [Candidatus Altiarchaeales archaeon]